jgi:uncharacterized membrane protein
METSAPVLRPNAALVYGLAMILALIGICDALYLTVQHLTGKSVKCSVTSGCSVVLSSSYATIAGIPTAAFGVLAYFAVFSLATLAVFGHNWARTGLLAVVTPMLLMTLWLVYLQAFVLHAFCQFCLLSAALTVLLTCLAFVGKFKLPAQTAST